MDDAIGRLFTQYLPTYFDLLEKYQYQKALLIVKDEEDSQWKGWDAVKVMIKLGASCESTYHSMKYLEAELVQTNTIEQMYSNLIVLMKYLADELKPIVTKQSRHFSIHSPTLKSNRNGSGTTIEGQEIIKEETESTRLAEIAICGDLKYYVDLLTQGAEFFSLRAPTIRIYCGLALTTVPRDYHNMLKQIKSMLPRYDALDHPLLKTMKLSAMEELRTLHAALQCEIQVAEYDFTRSIVALHGLKSQLRSWCDHIDASSDYPLFEGDDTGYIAGCDDEGMLLDESDENYDFLSDSIYSNASCHSTSSLVRGHLLNLSVSCDSRGVSCSAQGGRHVNTADDRADEKSSLENNQSGFSLTSSFSPASSETQSTFRRLFSHSNLLRRGSGLASALPNCRGLVQKPGDPYINSKSAKSSMPNNALEQAILGVKNGLGCNGGGTGVSLGAQGTSMGGGMVLGGTNLVAAEMMASSMKKQERDDGFALPVFQWSKRFYRSLVAKFTLYFHQWLDSFEKKTDLFTLELMRFIKTPLGISYLGLMDVLLSRAQRGNESTFRVMLILETQALENKGTHYYENGYRCPSSSDALYRRSDKKYQEEESDQVMKQKAIVLDEPSNSSGVNSSARSPSKGVAPLIDYRQSSDQEAYHALFTRIDREENEEQNDFSELWGLRSWPAVFCYPEESPPLDHWPNIISLIMDNRATIDSVCPVFQHFERRLKTTYYLSRVDEAMFLVLLAKEGKKSSEKIAQDFMRTVTENLQHLGVFAPRLSALASASSV
ncbi:Protein of unknown function DUF2003 [Plasmopara halstedii]|uniref:Uncharacterized protein n=1 Tax=Plasmopara halstedii TaxID=4781 RepID=A0A0P1A6T0_PLAHL|nr:Protein of unknown function DUF2003 [Plasmopara halstedii]CEG35789.1 Protein of unknown function DUF2003 [Plasmopara halstedii]|eukprot:XP_024572158.1 Protein of unknown function DUF2003 [Plasmopara halstedii]